MEWSVTVVLSLGCVLGAFFMLSVRLLFGQKALSNLLRSASTAISGKPNPELKQKPSGGSKPPPQPAGKHRTGRKITPIYSLPARTKDQPTPPQTDARGLVSGGNTGWPSNIVHNHGLRGVLSPRGNTLFVSLQTERSFIQQLWCVFRELAENVFGRRRAATDEPLVAFTATSRRLEMMRQTFGRVGAQATEARANLDSMNELLRTADRAIADGLVIPTHMFQANAITASRIAAAAITADRIEVPPTDASRVIPGRVISSVIRPTRRGPSSSTNAMFVRSEPEQLFFYDANGELIFVVPNTSFLRPMLVGETVTYRMSITGTNPPAPLANIATPCLEVVRPGLYRVEPVSLEPFFAIIPPELMEPLRPHMSTPPVPIDPRAMTL